MSRSGVNIYGYVYAESGVGEHTRLLVAAVREAGIDYAVVPFTDTLSRQQCRFDDLGHGEPVFDVNIIGVNADVFPEAVDHFGAGILTDRYTVGLWAWEIERFPAWMARSAQLVDEVWANSSYSAQSMQQAICRPVLPFPLPIKTLRPPSLSRAELGLPDGFLFLFCFDFDSVFHRKNPEAVIKAFTTAFRPGEGPSLFIKSVNGERQPELLARLSAAAGDRCDIHLVDSYWQDDEVQALMGLCDAYVSLHRSEGFGLTMAEAMALGKPVIATAYSGNLDYMTETNSYPVPYVPVTIGPGADPYPEHAHWAEPDIAAAAESLRRVWQHPAEVQTRTRQAQQDIKRLHSPRARSVFVRERLAIIFAELDGRRRRSPVAIPAPVTAPASAPAAREPGELIEIVRRRLVQGPAGFAWPCWGLRAQAFSAPFSQKSIPLKAGALSM